MVTYTFTEDVLATPPVVWHLLTDTASDHRWAGIRSMRVEQAGDGPTGRVGDIRAVTSWVGTVRERITTFEPEHRMSYELVPGALVRDYHGSIVLEPHDNGTRVTWTVEFTPSRYLAPVVGAVVKRLVRRTIRGLTAEATRQMPST